MGEAVEGEIVTSSGVRHAVTGTFSSNQLFLHVGEMENSNCYFVTLYSTGFTYDLHGSLIVVSGQVEGHCCGTVAGTFSLHRRVGA